MDVISTSLSKFGAFCTDWVSYFFNTNQFWSTIIAIVIVLWLISFLIILPLHRLSLRKAEQAKKDLTVSVDEIIYLLSKAQYSLSEQQTLQYDPCFALMKTMFESWHFEYIDNLDTIKENVQKVEVLLHQRVISDEQRNNIEKQRKSLRNHLNRSHILWYELNIVTLWIYNLFW